MKKLIIAVLLLMGSMTASYAEVNRSGNTFEVVSAKTSAETSIETKYTFKYNGAEYVICLSKNGRAFCNVISKNGKPYKKYLGEEISRTICKELGVEYKETTKK